MDSFKNILVIRTDRIGDVLLSTPAIRALKESFPSSVITVLTSLLGADVLDGNPYVDRIIVFSEKFSFFGLLRFTSFLREKNFDLVVIMNPNKFFHIAAFLAGVKTRLGYDRKCGFFLTHKIRDNKHNATKHEIEYNLDLVSVIGAKVSDKKPIFVFSQDDMQSLGRKLKFCGINIDYFVKEPLLVAVHAGTSNPKKRWAVEKFAKLIDRISSELGKKVCIVGSDEDDAIVKDLSKIITTGFYVNLVGKLTLKELGAFLGCCKVIISTDSGPAHIAASVGTKTITFFPKNVYGVSPTRWRPYALDNDIIWKNLNNISVDEVFEIVRHKFNTTDAPGRV